ncbi:MAG: PhoH family protein [Candidatus Eremiobacteraeota bacterium]|nr:PhoH family protein [Candidatus Eremiobacteraeota bacterium]
MPEARTERVFELAGVRDPLSFCGHLDRNLTALEGLVPVVVNLDGDRLRVTGAPRAVDSATEILGRMRDAANGGAQLTPDDVALAARELGASEPPRAHPKTLFTTQRGKDVRPRTEGQRRFVDAVEANTLTFGIGPAGTGKTFLAMVMAVRALRAREVSKIVLSRPAVEAGEKLGFLPGDLKEKVDPYLRPLYDALAELLDDGVTAKFVERGTIEVAPLAYMRGRTLADAFVILDEAQNATREQLKMFLTRLGANSRMVVGGDVTQIDLPRGVRSGLLDVPRLFAGIDDIAIVELDETDVVRHPLIGKIIGAYGRLT